MSNTTQFNLSCLKARPLSEQNTTSSSLYNRWVPIVNRLRAPVRSCSYPLPPHPLVLPSGCPPILPSVSPPIRLSVPSVCPPIRLSSHPSVLPSVSLPSSRPSVILFRRAHCSCVQSTSSWVSYSVLNRLLASMTSIGLCSCDLSSPVIPSSASPRFPSPTPPSLSPLTPPPSPIVSRVAPWPGCDAAHLRGATHHRSPVTAGSRLGSCGAAVRQQTVASSAQLRAGRAAPPTCTARWPHARCMSPDLFAHSWRPQLARGGHKWRRCITATSSWCSSGREGTPSERRH